ncbi:RnfABCDGE type electron transport complex subunit A [Candidatus Dependentiae bacterium]|nr:RnfABCDGE type electron transport complex subunit A [Candidatus Dependentiae bacterium]
MKEYLLIIISVALINNFVLVRFLGICPFIGVSKKIETALGMGLAVIFVITIASIMTFIINYLFLLPADSNLLYKFFGNGKNIPADFDFRDLQTIIFILSIATLVQLVEMAMKKYRPALYQALGIYLPLITTNCAVLGVALINVQDPKFQNSLLKSAINGFGAALGFTIALIIMSGLREKFEYINIPKPLQGVPIALITAGILSLCFMGFSGIVK